MTAAGVSEITGRSITALEADSHAELMLLTSEEMETAGFLSGFSCAAVLDATPFATSVLAEDIADDKLEVATFVLADDHAEDGEDITLEYAAVSASSELAGLDF